MKIKVWDAPTRIFHWLLVAGFALAFLTRSSERLLEYHTIAGYTALGLVSFRVLWGFTGNRYARFSQFLKGWAEVREYVKKTLRLSPPRTLGHNPAVGWVVVLMLAMTFTITISGIITYSGEEARGLLSGVFSYPTARAAKEVHEVLAFTAIAVIAVHVGAAFFHDFILRENIIFTMITGTREDNESWSGRVARLEPGEGRSKARLAVWLFVTVIIAAGAVYVPSKIAHPSGQYETAPVSEGGGNHSHAPVNEAWKTECSGCHNLFHPTLLPAASWRKVMNGLSNHFGDDASLEPETRAEIEDYLTAYSAERSMSEASKKLSASIKDNDTPVRVTEIAYWRRKHSEIRDDVWKRKSVMDSSNCGACHPGAEEGSFEDADIRIPR